MITDVLKALGDFFPTWLDAALVVGVLVVAVLEITVGGSDAWRLRVRKRPRSAAKSS